jgi:[ribosomal protein S5]-alanine N-acetyltransferase
LTRDDAISADVIESSRLELVLLSREFLEALLEGRRDEAQAIVSFPVPDGWPKEHEPHFRMRLTQMQNNPATEGWLVRSMVLKEPTRLAIGRIGFHGPPGVNGQKDPTAVEMGYDIDVAHRRHGYASEAVRAMVSWASNQDGVKRVLAAVAISNEPSLALARKLGYVQVGTQSDEEDGDELVFEVPWPAGDLQ